MENYVQHFNNTDQIFIVNRSELEGRIDPNQYHIERREAIALLSKNNTLLKLKDVVTNEKMITTIIEEENIYIGLENIKSNTGEYLPSAEKATISSAGIFKKGHILFPKLRPYLNKVYLAEFDGICSTEFHIFKTKSYLPEFLSIYLRSSLILNQTKHLMTGNTLPRLQTEDINNLPVPELSVQKQEEIVLKYQLEFSKKQKKESEVKNLLSSVDKYLKFELGISSIKKDPDFSKQFFTISYSKITGDRLDPEMVLYSQTISESKYPLISLGELLLKNPQYGANEEGIDREDINTPRYIRITDIDSFGFLKDNLGKTAAIIEEKYLLEDKDILFARSGNTVGKSYIHNKDEVDYDCFFAGYMIRFIVDETKLLPAYLFAYTQSEPYKDWVKAIQRTAGQPNINAEEYKSFKIPLPPLEKQKEIAEQIKSIRSEAIRIQKEADQILEFAKLEVERMILGE